MNKIKKSLFRNPIFILSITIFSLVTSLLIILNATEKNVVYSPVALLPFAFILLFYLFFPFINNETMHNIGFIIFMVIFIIKCIISPFMLAIGNFKSIFIDLTIDYIWKSVFLMIYEYLICLITICFASRMTRKKDYLIKNNYNTSSGLDVLVIVFLLIMVFMWILIPDINNNFVTLGDMIKSEKIFTGFDYKSINAAGTSNRIFTTLFLVLFKSARIIIPYYFIKRLKERYCNLFTYVVSIILIMLQFYFISETIAMAIIDAGILFSYVWLSYPKYKKMTIVVIGILGVIVVAILSLFYEYLANYYGIDNSKEFMSQILQSYFPGVCNTASVFRVERHDGFITLFDTLISTIPFQNSLFGSVVWNQDLNTLYTNTNGLNSQIISTIAGGWYIFGYVFSPFFSALFTYVSIKNGFKLSKNDDIRKIYHLYMCIQSILGVGIYNIQTTISLWIQVGLVLNICSAMSQSLNRGYVWKKYH